MTLCIVTPVFRAAPWVTRCLQSLQQQTLQEFRCVVCDDQSDDDTVARAQAAVAGDSRFEIVRNEHKLHALGGLIAGIQHIATDPQDVIITVDGDDWLRHHRVLETVRVLYADPDVWLTYGSHQRWKNKLLHRLGWTVRRGIAAPYPADVIAARGYRTHKFLASHLRTFRRFLFDAIRDEHLRDETGAYYRIAGDVAHMVPMLEMAGAKHVRFVEEMLYVYNNANPISDHRVQAEAQQRVTDRIASMTPYPLLPVPALSGGLIDDPTRDDAVPKGGLHG